MWQKACVTDQATGVEGDNEILAQAYLEGCLEHRSGSKLSDCPWFNKERNSISSRKPPYPLNLVDGRTGFKLNGC